MSAQHTPCTCTARCGDCPGIRSGETVACDAYVTAQNDARMRNAAPELMAALQDIYRELHWDSLPPAKKSLADNARAALAKATGSTSS